MLSRHLAFRLLIIDDTHLLFCTTCFQIFSTYSGENIGNCRGHNGKVRSIYWTPDDSGLVSSGMDGAVYEWELKEGMWVMLSQSNPWPSPQQ